MTKTIFTSLSPNTQKDDMLLALSLLGAHWQWQAGESIQELEKTIASFLPATYAFSFVSGRTCLYVLLKALNLEENDEVLLQSYTCVAVPDPVLWAGLTPVYVDIDPESYTMSPEDLERKITKKSRVLIIQHTFGITADIERLIKIAKKYNLFVIEDCAHALGSEHKGRYLGTFGDASFFSFGRDKSISSVFGGILTTNNEEIGQKIAKVQKSYSYPQDNWIFKQLMYPILTAFIKTTYDTIGIGKVLFFLLSHAGVLSKAVHKEEKKGEIPKFVKHRMPNALAYLALRQFRKLKKYNTHRKTIADIYSQSLEKSSFSLPKTHNPLIRYPVQSEKSKEIMSFMKGHKIFLGDWYTTGIAPNGVQYQKIGYDPKTCPNAEKVAKHTFNLPTDIHVTKEMAQQVVETLKEYLKSQ